MNSIQFYNSTVIQDNLGVPSQNTELIQNKVRINSKIETPYFESFINRLKSTEFATLMKDNDDIFLHLNYALKDYIGKRFE
jgi:hypothetical protein